VAAIAERIGAISELAVDDRNVRFRVPDGASVLPGLLRELDAAGIAMTSVEVRRPSLDDVFLSLTGRTLRDAEQKVSA
jgi:ABC-2 type transport system ATP-binding protein